MNFFRLTSLSIAVCMMVSCHTTKKTETISKVTISKPEVIEEIPVSEAVKSKNGVFAPGQEQATAVKEKYPDATLQQLTEGYGIYTGTCTNCHGTKSIYRISEVNWPYIIDDMSMRSRLTTSQKEALTKYIFAIKATQPVGK